MSMLQDQFVLYNVCGNQFEVPQRYSEVAAIGLGAFGLVCSAFDNFLQMPVAIKKIHNPFLSAVLSKRTYRELRLLNHMNHENVIALKDVFISASRDVYIVTELLGADLHQVITSQKLDDQYIRYFLYQILRGLKYIHSAGVIHRDLKPSNLLVNENCDLKICDFGLARVADPEMTGYVATRYYRAPEIMLTWQHYDNAVDIWSAGCILAELLLATPLFPGKDHIQQFSLITELLGSPSDDVLRSICSENTLKYIQSLPERSRVDFSTKFPNAHPQAVDLLDKMLVFEPHFRITAEAALGHPYLKDFHDSTDEPTVVVPFDWSFNEKDLPLQAWEEMIFAVVNEIRVQKSRLA